MATAPKAAPKAASQTVQKPSQALATVAAAPTYAPLVPIASGALALPAEFAEELANAAKDEASTERPSISRISLRAGMISFQGNPVAGNRLPCVILATVYERSFYTEKFDPDNVVSPACFALRAMQKDEELTDLAPHEVVLNPRSESCGTCKYNEWKSDLQGRNGKACKERRRLVLLPVSALASPDDVRKAELALLATPVTSVREYAKFVNTLAATVKAPPYAVVTEITTRPDIKNQFVVDFTPTSVIADPEILRAVMAKREEAYRVGLVPFEPKVEDEKEEEAPSPAAPAKKSKF